MRCLVTGAAGFIGSHLCRKLLEEGHEILGIDSFSDYYPRWIKERNLSPLVPSPGFQFLEGDIITMDLRHRLEKADVIFHLAAQAGVRASWGTQFATYTANNIQATQLLLEAVKDLKIRRFVYASSSSVYGLCPDLPMSETSPLRPYSPYGVTKLAAEHLCQLYFTNYGVPCVSLRFFTVFGPGQRPDMAFHKFFRSVLEDKALSIYGDGSQTRDFTFVDDIVRAHLAVLEKGKPGEVYNVGGGNRVVLNDVFPMLGRICGTALTLNRLEIQKGDVRDTYADIDKIFRDCDFKPEITLEEGLEKEWAWIQNLYTSEQRKSAKESTL